MVERNRDFYQRLIIEANRIAVRNRRGAANFIVATPRVCAILEMLPEFQWVPVQGDVNTQPVGIAKVGSLGGRFNVYRDTRTEVQNTLYYGGDNAGIQWSELLELSMLSLVTRDLSSTILVSFIVLTFLSWFRELSVLTTSLHVLDCLLVMVLLTTSSVLISTTMSLLFRDLVQRLLRLHNRCTSNISTSLVEAAVARQITKQQSESSAVFF
jgi:hypothetical protein